MFVTLILAAMMPGQVQACLVRGTYQQNAVRQNYTAPIYQQTYAAQTYAAPTYAPQYETAYVAVQYYPDYTSIVGEATRARDRRQEALLGQANLAARVEKLSASIEGLAARIGTIDVGPVVPPPVIPQPPVVPGKPTPVAPSKPTPDVPAKPAPTPDVPPTPPLPNTNPAVPDDGSVPPPPVPGTAFIFPEAAAAVLKANCIKCHSVVAAPTVGGRKVLFTEDGNVRSDLTAPQLLEIVRQTEMGRMPKKAQPLGQDERGLIRAPIMASPAVEAFLEAALPKVAE